MDYYFIDFENTGTAGLQGVEGLLPKDEIYIFCKQKNNGNISIDTLCSIKCKYSLKRITGSGLNYLDFQLVMFIAEFVCQKSLEPNDKICIVSKDQGFKAALDVLKVKNISCSLQPSISGKIPENEEKKITPPHNSALKTATKNEVKKVLADLKNSKSSQIFNDVYGKIRSSKSVKSFKEWVNKNYPTKKKELEKCFYLERAK